jgi:hypothetical protein
MADDTKANFVSGINGKWSKELFENRLKLEKCKLGDKFLTDEHIIFKDVEINNDKINDPSDDFERTGYIYARSKKYREETFDEVFLVFVLFCFSFNHFYFVSMKNQLRIQKHTCELGWKLVFVVCYNLFNIVCLTLFVFVVFVC